MNTILHLLDESAGWEQRLALGQLLDRSPGGQVQFAAGMNGVPRESIPSRISILKSLSAPHLLPIVAAATLSKLLDRHAIDVIHAWGTSAAIAACAASARPVILQLFDPVAAVRDARKLRTLARREKFAISCSSAILRRRLAENGVPIDRTVVIRPGIDFAALSRSRRGDLRTRFGIGADEFVVIVPEPVKRDDGAFEVFWAAALLNHLHGKIRIIVPGASSEQRRIAEFAATVPSAPCLICPGVGVRFEELMGIADVLAVAPRGDISTTSIALAMSAGVPVIGSATYAVAELIANKVNGLLFKRPAGKGVSAAIARLLSDREGQKRCKEAAHGQAFQVFGLRRFIEQTMRLHENLLKGAAPGDGIADSAMAG